MSTFQIFVIGIGGRTLTIDGVSNDLTILSLREKVFQKTGIPANEQVLIYSGKTLQNQNPFKQTMNVGDYAIEKESTLHLVLRLQGGMKVKVVLFDKEHEYDIEKEKTIADLKRLIKGEMSISVHQIKLSVDDKELKNGESLEDVNFKDGAKVDMDKMHDEDSDIVLTQVKGLFTLDDSKDSLRAMMCCGHAVTPMGLTQYCRSMVDSKVAFRFVCPYIDVTKIGDARFCRKEWTWKVVRKVAVLTSEEKGYFEKKLNINYMLKHDIQECPKCKTFGLRLDKSHKRVVCTKCKHDFCWGCLQEWKTSGTKTCGNYQCSARSTADFLESVKNDKTDFDYIPVKGFLYRACVWCGSKVQFWSGCKHVQCTNGCEKEFCFVCLKKKINGKWNCGTFSTPCSLAPLQTFDDIKDLFK